MLINYYRLKESLFSRINGLVLKPFFKKCGKSVYINRLLKVDGFKNIIIGDNVRINYKTWLAASNSLNEDCLLEIGNGSAIGNFNHIFATKHVKIGEFVLTADKVYISDNLHRYENPDIPIILQGVKQLNSVEVGDGTWIGENACIIGAKIGKNCVIAANAVVTKDIPDYCVAAGVPAKIIKKFNLSSNKWEKTNENGEFVNT